MSNTHTADGKRRSSMTHARRGHLCGFCDKVSFGNGGKVAHGRSHVRRGEAVELLKVFPTTPPMSSRLFITRGDPAVADYMAKGYIMIADVPGDVVVFEGTWRNGRRV